MAKTQPTEPTTEPTAAAGPKDAEAELLKMLGVATLDEAEALISAGKNAPDRADAELGLRTRALMKNLGFEAFEGLEKAVADAATITSKATAKAVTRAVEAGEAAKRAGVRSDARGAEAFVQIGNGEETLQEVAHHIAFVLNTGFAGCSLTELQNALLTPAVAMQWCIDLMKLDATARPSELRARISKLGA